MHLRLQCPQIDAQPAPFTAALSFAIGMHLSGCIPRLVWLLEILLQLHESVGATVFKFHWCICRTSKVVIVVQSNPNECWFISYESTRASTNSHQRNNLLTHVYEITHLAWLSKSNWLSATSSVSFASNLIWWMVLDWLLNRYLNPLESGFIHSITSEWKFTIVWWLHHVD